jgi:ectoine hydroxylase-related dioxygenase (phytanoyl-CoA dioxygenase family)
MADRRNGDEYTVSQEEVDFFRREGYVHLKAVISEQELGALREAFGKFRRGEIFVPGDDFCDMAPTDGRKTAIKQGELEKVNLFNVMLPSTYYPPLKGNVLERRAASIAKQLYAGQKDMVLDFDMLLDKAPHAAVATFPAHQDLAYWPPSEYDGATATVWCAIDDSTKANGAMFFVPQTHAEAELRPHKRLGKTREEAHALELDLTENDKRVMVFKEIPAGDVTVHCERIIHGSGGNFSDKSRRAYVCAFRTAETVAWERSLGFSHSHNSTVNHDSWNKSVKDEQKAVLINPDEVLKEQAKLATTS